MSFLGLLAVLVLWAALTAYRRRREAVHRRAQSPPSPSGARSASERRQAVHRDDEIDYDELEAAEREVRDMETDAKGRPREDVIGDDWGPGTPKPPYA